VRLPYSRYFYLMKNGTAMSIRASDSVSAELGKTWLKAGADHFRDVGRAVGHVRSSGESALMSSVARTSVEDCRVG
jgi:hypothetical protein